MHYKYKVSAYDLRCEYTNTPLGISRRNPRFSWKIQSVEHNIIQTAYHIIVGKSRNLKVTDDSLVWNSGVVYSNRQYDIEYEGKSLEALTGYFWRVKLICGEDTETEWSEPAYFECGFFDVSDWKANWTAYKWAHIRPCDRSVNHIRKEFAVEGKNIKRARAYIAATSGALGNDTLRMNLYEVRLNGKKVGRDLYNPGQISERKGRALYRTYDITDLLVKGKNAIGIIFASSKISFQILIEYSDGKITLIGNDSGSRINLRGPYIKLWRHDLYEYGGKGEYYDAREEYTGWDMPGFDDSSWKKALSCSPAELLAAQMQSAQVTETLDAKKIRKLPNGKYVIDFGQCINGHAAIWARGKAGTKITMRFGENIFENGAVNFHSTLTMQQPSGNEQYIHEDVYIKKSDEPEYYAPCFANHGFRYVEVSGYEEELTPEDIKANVVHSTVLDGSRFETSDKWLQRLYNLFIWTYRSNLMSVATDNAARERQGWTGDPLTTTPDMCIAFDMQLFYEKRFNDFEDCQERNGYIPYICPFPMVLSHIEVVWSGYILHNAWEAYLAYGNKSFLAQHYGLLKRFMEFVNSLYPDLTKKLKNHSAWYDPKSLDTEASRDYYVMVYCCRWFDLFSKIAGVLGQTEDENFYKGKYKILRDTINREFFVENEYYDTDSQAANAQALHFGIVFEEYRERLLNRLVENIMSWGGIRTGLIDTYNLIMALEENNKNDVIYKLLRSDNPYTWGHWLTHYNATTALERFHYDGPPERTPIYTYNQNSGYIGGITGWFYRVLAGIRAASPGYDKIIIKPYMPQGLNDVSALINTVHGPARSSWRRAGKTIVIDIDIPCNTTAEIFVPCSKEETVYEEHFFKESAKDAPIIYDDGVSYKLYKTGSGRYTFIIESYH